MEFKVGSFYRFKYRTQKIGMFILNSGGNESFTKPHRNKIQNYPCNTLFMFLETKFVKEAMNPVKHIFLAPDGKIVWDGFPSHSLAEYHLDEVTDSE